MLVKPLHQRSAGVQRDTKVAKGLKNIQKRTIAVFVSLLKDVIEVADRLMIVQGQAESERGRHGFLLIE